MLINVLTRIYFGFVFSTYLTLGLFPTFSFIIPLDSNYIFFLENRSYTISRKIHGIQENMNIRFKQFDVVFALKFNNAISL